MQKILKNKGFCKEIEYKYIELCVPLPLRRGEKLQITEKFLIVAENI